MKIVVASDERTALTDFVVEYLKHKGHEIILDGDLVKKDGKWVEIGRKVGEMVESGDCKFGNKVLLRFAVGSAIIPLVRRTLPF